MTATTTNNKKIDYTTIVDGKQEENHWILKSVLFITLLVCLGLSSTTNNATRFVNNEPVAATSSLVRGGAGAGASDRDGVRGGRIQVTQWNSHWENSVTVKGPLKTQGVVNNLVYGNDFVNLVMFEDRNYEFGGAYRKITNGDYCTKYQASWDMIVYDSSKWHTVNNDVHGCIYDNDRPFVVQKFKNNNDGTEVTVVGAHFPHPGQGPNFYSTLAGKIGQVSGGPGNNIIFMGDINDQIPSQTLFDRLGLGALKVASDLYNTCCYHDGFVFKFDRIGANFGSNAYTTKFETLLFDPNPTNNNSGEYHKPVQLTFNY